jgi:DNA-binding transcriptional LysR family regulator
MNDRFFSLQLFARAARSRSFSVAGREMGISQPTASRIVAALEKQIGVALLVRTTRAVTLTEAGFDYLSRIEAILTALEEADHAARGTGELRGMLARRRVLRLCNTRRPAAFGTFHRSAP